MVEAINFNQLATTVLTDRKVNASKKPVINPHVVELVAFHALAQSWRNLSATITKNARASKEDDQERQEKLSTLKSSAELTTFLNSRRFHADIHIGPPNYDHPSTLTFI